MLAVYAVGDESIRIKKQLERNKRGPHTCRADSYVHARALGLFRYVAVD